MRSVTNEVSACLKSRERKMIKDLQNGFVGRGNLGRTPIEYFRDFSRSGAVLSAQLENTFLFIFYEFKLLDIEDGKKNSTWFQIHDFVK